LKNWFDEEVAAAVAVYRAEPVLVEKAVVAHEKTVVAGHSWEAVRVCMTGEV
jgi:hypothetical protein